MSDLGLDDAVELSVEQVKADSEKSGIILGCVFDVWVIENHPTDEVYYLVHKELGL